MATIIPCPLRRRSRGVNQVPRRAPKTIIPRRAACACLLAGREYSRAALGHLAGWLAGSDEKERARMEGRREGGPAQAAPGQPSSYPEGERTSGKDSVSVSPATASQFSSTLEWNGTTQLIC